MTDTLEASTKIYAPKSEVYDFLCDFNGYAKYSDYIEDVTQRGDGGEGTDYGITLSWWKVSYTAWSRVTALSPHDTIKWELTKDLNAHGSWNLEPTSVEDDSVDEATRITLTVEFEPDSANGNALSLPPLVPLSTVITKARPIFVREAKRVLSRVISDMENASRQPTLTIHSRPDSV